MKKDEIVVGGTYEAKVSGRLTTVRVENIRESRGLRRSHTAFDVLNLKTDRRTTFHSAARFRRRVPTVHNNTPFSPEEIASFPVLAHTINNWRKRNIKLRQHPADQGMVVSEGVAFDGDMVVFAVEPKEQWATALDYAQHGRVYISQ